MTEKIELGQLIQERYRIRSILNYGGYGVVWEAWHENLKTPLAIKMIDISSMDVKAVERIKRECTLGGELKGLPGIVPVLDALEEGPHLLIVMDLMAGGDLAKCIHKGTVPFTQALEWATNLCETLEQVHAKGIIHRDIKPQNILLDAHQHVKLGDFGIAHVNRSHLTAGSHPGTPAYKAPELDAGQPATSAADIYSLCAVLFELWSGRQYADYKALDTKLVHDEFLACLEKPYADVPAACREALAKTLLGGLAPIEQRIDLQTLKSGLRHVLQCLAGSGNEPLSEPLQVSPAMPALPSPLILRPATAGRGGGLPPSESTAVAEWLIEEFEYVFQEEIWNGSRRTIFFWYDPEGKWTAILPLLEGRVPLILDRGSLLEMRYELERRTEKEPVILYLRRSPEKRERIAYLIPYQFLSRPLTLEPYDILRRQGISLPAAGPDRQKLQLLLPQLLAASLGQGESFWHSINNYTTARAKLVGDVQEQTFRLIATPLATWNNLCNDKHEHIFAEEVQQHYGYSNPGEAPESFARNLVSRWCLLDIYLTYGQPADFPARDVLPPSTAWGHCQTAWKNFRNDRRFSAIVIQITREIEEMYQGVLDWARRQERTVEDAPLLGIARIAWERTMQRIAACQDRSEVVALLRSNAQTFQSASQGFWAQQGLLPGWQALAQGAQALLSAETAYEHSTLLQELADFVEAYSNGWWKVDADYRQYRSLPASDTVAAPLTRWVEQSYRRYLEQTNRTWTAKLASEHAWPPSSQLAAQTTLWTSIAQGKGQRAIFFIDALRYDLAQEVATLLRQDGQMTINLEPYLAGLPSITPLGMAALLPQADKQQVTWVDDWHIIGSQSKGNLADKSPREEFLKQHLRGAVTISLEDLLRSQTKPPQETNWLFVFSQEIDALGENASAMLFDAFSSLIQRLVQGIRKVLDAGFSSVHLVTDHGFLLLNRVTESDKIDIPNVQPLKLHQRYLLGRDLIEHSSLLRFPVRNSVDLWAYYPPGIGVFVTPGRYQYSHGGPTLHEVVIPHLVARPIPKKRRVNVRLKAPEHIHNAIFKVELHPEASTLFDLERDVRVAIERQDGTQLYEVEALVSRVDSSSINLRLTPAYRISPGGTVAIVVRDAQTGEELDRQSSIVHVELEL